MPARNILRGDKLIQLDMSPIKNFRIAESKRVDFRAQVFHLTNTPGFSSPKWNRDLATSGQKTSTQNRPRVFEFGLKI